jgi:protein-S-isoprenylcysteine O-methyltransferase Ste14
VHPFTAAPPVARLLLIASAVVWLLVELRESTNRRPEATKSDAGSRQYIRVASIVGVVGAVVLTRNVSSGRISPDVAWVGLVVFWCGIALRFWSFRALGRYFTFTVQTSADQPVISSGPYRFVRHPSYAAVLLMVMGVGLFLGSWWSFAWLTASVLCGLLFRIRVEERALLLQLGDRYDTYAAGHKRLVPFLW